MDEQESRWLSPGVDHPRVAKMKEAGCHLTFLLWAGRVRVFYCLSICSQRPQRIMSLSALTKAYKSEIQDQEHQASCLRPGTRAEPATSSPPILSFIFTCPSGREALQLFEGPLLTPRLAEERTFDDSANTLPAGTRSGPVGCWGSCRVVQSVPTGQKLRGTWGVFVFFLCYFMYPGAPNSPLVPQNHKDLRVGASG